MKRDTRYLTYTKSYVNQQKKRKKNRGFQCKHIRLISKQNKEAQNLTTFCEPKYQVQQRALHACLAVAYLSRSRRRKDLAKSFSLGLQKNMKSIFREKKKTLKKKHIFRKKTEKYFFLQDFAQGMSLTYCKPI